MNVLLLTKARDLINPQHNFFGIAFNTLVLLSSTLVTSTAYAESLWQLSPIDVMGTGVPGFTEHTESLNQNFVQNPTPSFSSYRWYAQRRFSSDDFNSDRAGVSIDFKADGHHTLEIWVGDGSLRSTRGFEKLMETRQNFRDRFMLEPRPEWRSRGTVMKLVLKKDHNVAVESSVLRFEGLHSETATPSEALALNTMESIERTESLKIGAFNIQVFGASKSRKDDVMDSLVDILTRYDITLIQEIRDSSGTAIVSLLARLNAENQSDFGITVSERHGSTEMKEQYAYFYRRSKVQLMTARSFHDTNNDFERPPYIAQFREISTRQDFALIGVHVDPDEAYHEIESLHEVSNYVKRSLREPDLIVMGDLNADCTYLRHYELEELPLYYRDIYTWQITSEADTTTGLNTCAYDRIITRGDTTDWTKSSGVYRFDRALRLSRDEVRRISDHYPVEITLKLPVQADG